MIVLLIAFMGVFVHTDPTLPSPPGNIHLHAPEEDGQGQKVLIIDLHPEDFN